MVANTPLALVSGWLADQQPDGRTVFQDRLKTMEAISTGPESIVYEKTLTQQ